MAHKKRTPDEKWAADRMMENHQGYVPDKEVLRVKALLMFVRELDARLDELEPGFHLGLCFNIQIIRNDRRSPQYEQWRTAVYERDDYTCQECGHRGQLVAHHIDEWAKYPDRRFAVDNGVTLCEDCHAKKHPHMAVLQQKKAKSCRGRQS